MRKAARRIVEKLRLHGHEAFFAGGYIRDTLLRRKPGDIDIATSARPEEVLRIFPRSVRIGARFGVVQVRMYRCAFDVATFRSEGPYQDGRHPSHVDFTGPKQDALRRDFTINGLFFDPIAGRLIDYVGGAADLRRGIVRTIGTPLERFREDKLRMLRAVRFACALHFRIAEETHEAIRQLAPAILEVSWERIRDEVLHILTGPMPGRGLDLLHDTGLLLHILPEVEAMRGVSQPEAFHPEGDVYIHTRRTLDLLRKPSPVLAMAAMLHDVGKPLTVSLQEDRIRFNRHAEVGAQLSDTICRRLRMSNDETGRIVELVRCHLHFLNIRSMRRGTLKRFLNTPHFEDHLELHRADCLSSHGDLDAYRFALEKYEEWKSASPLPPRLITGHDLIDMGYSPGPAFSKILLAIENLQMEDPALTRDKALECVRRQYPADKIPGESHG